MTDWKQANKKQEAERARAKAEAEKLKADMEAEKEEIRKRLDKLDAAANSTEDKNGDGEPQHIAPDQEDDENYFQKAQAIFRKKHFEVSIQQTSREGEFILSTTCGRTLTYSIPCNLEELKIIKAEIETFIQEVE